MRNAFTCFRVDDDRRRSIGKRRGNIVLRGQTRDRRAWKMRQSRLPSGKTITIGKPFRIDVPVTNRHWQCRRSECNPTTRGRGPIFGQPKIRGKRESTLRRSKGIASFFHLGLRRTRIGCCRLGSEHPVKSRLEAKSTDELNIVQVRFMVLRLPNIPLRESPFFRS